MAQNQDIYGQEVNYGGAFSADGAKLTFSADVGGGAVQFNKGFLTQQLGVQYAQNTSRIYSLVDNKYYMVRGRSQGTASLSGLVGPEGLQLDFYRKFGDVCKLDKNSFSYSFVGNCGAANGAQNRQKANMTVQHAVIQSLSNNVAATDFLFNEAISMMFLFYKASQNNAALAALAAAAQDGQAAGLIPAG